MNKPNFSEEELISLLKSKQMFSEKVRLAIEQAKKSHKTQKRDDGSEYLTQHIYPIVADLLSVTDLEDVIIGALLHDVLEDDPNADKEELKTVFGQHILEIVLPLTKKPEDNTPGIAPKKKTEINKNMLKNLENAPPESKLIKLADRTNNIQSSRRESMKKEKYERYVKETKELFLPFAKKNNEYFYKKMQKIISFHESL